MSLPSRSRHSAAEPSDVHGLTMNFARDAETAKRVVRILWNIVLRIDS